MTQADFDLSILLSREQRQKNADAILNTLQPEQQDFNVMLMGFVDIIQSTFYSYLHATYERDEEQFNAMEARINRSITEVMKVLNRESGSNPEDMVILSTVILEAISKALQRQSNGDVQVKTDLSKK